MEIGPLLWSVVRARFYDLLCRVEPVPAVTTFSPTERLEPSGT